MIDDSEKRNLQLALNFRIRLFVKSVVIEGVRGAPRKGNVVIYYHEETFLIS